MEIQQWETRRGDRPVEKFIQNQPDKVQAKFAEILVDFGYLGPEYCKTKFMDPVSGHKHKLYALKFYKQKIWYRILLIVVSGNESYLLHGFPKKSNKIELKDIRTALSRADEIIESLK